ncbi:unnamed protein product [Parnassius apollo]|uniref:(apollo) hypothetical protein n=1 Tax=Parnassius apollo TaxID=110799 RepID=A0A8S3WAQ0_PARAO|nr:unnamed protein product [Parnassius apollo]
MKRVKFGVQINSSKSSSDNEGSDHNQCDASNLEDDEESSNTDSEVEEDMTPVTLLEYTTEDQNQCDESSSEADDESSNKESEDEEDITPVPVLEY